MSPPQAVYIYEAIFARQQAENWDPADGDAVNLHGYSQAVAKAAVRSGLSRVLQRFLVAGEHEEGGAVTRDTMLSNTYIGARSEQGGKRGYLDALFRASYLVLGVV